ncbi:MAG: hypothetical protein DWQ36_05370 [Acidobacteria bacterium]|nr:MAG: hypothetical protein DWQ30_12860 [Acidobacteriota bacterium]REK10071.1 MAG: hypothetical protein DWQ36_05370 [Acidobacteriota bacterium]
MADDDAVTSLEEHLAHDAQNIEISRRNLEHIFGRSEETIDVLFRLFKELAQAYADEYYCALQPELFELSEQFGVDPVELTNLLRQGALLGADEREMKAQEQAIGQQGLLNSLWLLLKMDRDCRNAISQLLRLQMTQPMGHLRLQAEAAALIVLFHEVPVLGRDWIDTLDPQAGRRFYTKHQRRIKEALKNLRIEDLYEQGSTWALHVRPQGIAGSVEMAGPDSPKKLDFSHQEFGRSPYEASLFILEHLDSERRVLKSLVDNLPRLSDRPELATAFEQLEELKQEWGRALSLHRRQNQPRG